MTKLVQLLDNNKIWAANLKQQDPAFFSGLAQIQTPEFLWIGCSDSRLPANTIVDLPPGQLFVHRNVANVVTHTDSNCMSVIQYATEVLKVKHIIVCGHYGCGGVIASLAGSMQGPIEGWLEHIRKVYRVHEKRFAGIEDENDIQDLLCELNVIEQVKNVCSTKILQDAWKAGQKIYVHGWIYRIADGILKDMDITVSGLKPK